MSDMIITNADPKKVPQRKLYTGAMMPGIGIGTFGSDRFTGEDIAKAVGDAVASGYRLIDCAACYGNEHLIGEALEKTMAETGIAREELFITSKIWNDMHGKGDVLLSVAKSLKDLRLDYLENELMLSDKKKITDLIFEAGFKSVQSYYRSKSLHE